MKKLPFLMLSFLIVLLLANCGDSDETDDFDDCSCDAFSSIEIEFNGIQVQALEMINENFFDAQVFLDPIAKDRLVLEVDLRFLDRIVPSPSGKGSSAVALTSAQRCSCVYPINLVNPLAAISVAMNIPGEAEFNEVSDAFQVVDFTDFEGFLTIEEALLASQMTENNYDFVSRYYLSIADLSRIPEEAAFRIRVVFDDESEFLQETQLVRFQ